MWGTKPARPREYGAKTPIPTDWVEVGKFTYPQPQAPCMTDHEQADTVPDDRDDAPETDETTDESDPLESTTVDETPHERRDTKGTESELGFAGRNAVRSIGLVAGLGTLIFWMPVLLTGFSTAMWIQFGLGLGIAVAGAVTAMKKGQDAASAIGLPLLAGVLGLLTAAMPFLIDVGSVESGPLATGNMVVGALVVVLSVAAIVGFRKDAAARTSTRSTTA